MTGTTNGQLCQKILTWRLISTFAFLPTQFLGLIFDASGPSGPGLIPNILQKISQEQIGDIAEVNQRRCLVESWQWLENVVRTS